MLATPTGKQRRHVTMSLARANRYHCPSLAVCALAPDIATLAIPLDIGSGTQHAAFAASLVSTFSSRLPAKHQGDSEYYSNANLEYMS